MTNAPTVAEKRPVLKLVIEVNRETSRLRLTNTRIPSASFFQASVIRLSSSLTSSRYIFHMSFSESFSSVIKNPGSTQRCNIQHSPTHHPHCVCPRGWTWEEWTKGRKSVYHAAAERMLSGHNADWRPIESGPQTHVNNK